MLLGMVASALSATGGDQPLARRMVEKVLDMPVEKLVVSGEMTCASTLLMRPYVPTMSSSWCPPTA